jgi:hypothetical protein
MSVESVRAFFAGKAPDIAVIESPASSATVALAAEAYGVEDAALATAAAEMKWLNGFSLAATFEGEFSNVTRSYAGKGVVRYQW